MQTSKSGTSRKLVLHKETLKNIKIRTNIKAGAYTGSDRTAACSKFCFG